MTYAALVDFNHRANALRQAGLVESTTVITTALQSASDKFDSYASTRYACPLTGTIPGAVVECVVSLAFYDVVSRLGAVDDRIRLEYEDTLTWLRDLAKGLVSLGIAPPPASLPSTVAYFDNATPTVSRDMFGIS